MHDERPRFLELPDHPLADANVVVVPMPWEGAVSYGGGTAEGPAATLAASQEIETWEEELGLELGEHLRIHTLDPVAPRDGERPGEYHARLRDEVAQLGLGDRFPLGLGGDHSVTAALMGGLREDWSGVTVVHIDAHADLREEYQGEPWSHACALARVLDLGVARLVSVGIRSAERGEALRAREDDRITTLHAHEMADPARWGGLLDELRGLDGEVWLTIDIDGLDVHLCPGTGTPMPGGLSWEQATAVLRALLLEGSANVIGADLCEVAPFPHSQVNETVAALLCRKLLGYRLGGQRR